MSSKRALAIAVSSLVVGSLSCVFAQTHKLSADDYIEIQQLYARYNNAIDTGDAEAYAATFTPDGSFNNFKGHDALVGFIHNWHDKMGGANRRHWNTNLLITPTAEGAHGTVYLMLLDVSTRPPTIGTAAKYDDELVKTKDGWLFTKRVTKGEGPPPAGRK
jgi:actinorhodin biosynthesis protein ActVIA